MKRHSEGPWKVSSLGRLIESQCFIPVARTANLPDADEQAANGRLIAAAPDLLTIAEVARDFWGGDAPTEILQLLENTFAKIEGREPAIIGDATNAVEQIRPDPFKTDYGGAFDGNTVTSDADPGL